MKVMKKLLFVFVAVAAMTIASCGGQVTPANTSSDSDTVMVDSLVDTLTVDTVE